MALAQSRFSASGIFKKRYRLFNRTKGFYLYFLLIIHMRTTEDAYGIHLTAQLILKNREKQKNRKKCFSVFLFFPVFLIRITYPTQSDFHPTERGHLW
jgi:hypothetical protein